MNSVFSDELKNLVEISNELYDIASSAAVLGWDQETHMPPKGAMGRAYQLAALSGVYHDKLTNEQTGKEIKEAKDKCKNEYDKALVREMQREYEKATMLPKKLVQDMSEAASRAFEAWVKAKTQKDFSVFVPALERILELKLQAANLVKRTGETIYDTMLDEHEPDLKEAYVEKVFGEVKEKLVLITSKYSEAAKEADKLIVDKNYPENKQWEFGLKVLKDMGYDFAAGRQDKSAHPFTTSFGIGDVRITTWAKDESDLRPALFASIHEGGHALYEQGVDLDLARTHLAGGQGLVLHESQSRMWENMIGRSEEFWNYYYPGLQNLFSDLKNVELKDFLKGINKVSPSLVRVEADEVTYGLHIILRFEIERELIYGKIKIKDLPTVWNEKMKKYLGIEPENDSEGVLQDVHWSHGSFGYFPTYFLGTMTAAQLWRVIKNQILNSKNQLNPEILKEIREWLRENLHKHGKLYTAGDLINQITGEPLNPNYYLEYLEKKFSKLYN